MNRSARADGWYLHPERWRRTTEHRSCNAVAWTVAAWLLVALAAAIVWWTR